MAFQLCGRRVTEQRAFGALTLMAALTPQQREQLADWLGSDGELYVDAYRPHSGASGTAYFLRSIEDLDVLLGEQSPQSVVTVFRRKQYPLRGAATTDLLTRALTQIRDGQWFAIVSMEHWFPTPCTWLGSGNSHAELRDAFSEIAGRTVAVGTNPFDECPEQIYAGSEEALIIT